jgi:uncharacterized membrane protein YhhN
MLGLSFFAMGVLVTAMIIVEGKALPRRVYAALKMLAASLFVAVGVFATAIEDTDGGRCFVAGLALSWLGDLLLIPKGGKKLFLAGLVAFLLAHVAYVPAFVLRGFDVRGFAGGVAFVVVPVVVVLRWLAPKVKGTMWKAVVAYVVVISAMVCTAAGCVVFGASDARGVTPVLLVGALAFWLSDILVARERFVKSAYVNRIFGIPLYFFAQLLLIKGFTG